VTDIPGAFLHADMNDCVHVESIVNQSATTKQEMPTYDRAIRDMENGANQYRVLEDSDEEGMYSKVQNVQFNNERE